MLDFAKNNSISAGLVKKWMQIQRDQSYLLALTPWTRVDCASVRWLCRKEKPPKLMILVEHDQTRLLIKNFESEQMML